jgi:hypothetical protein
MTKFRAQTIDALFTCDATAGRAVRKPAYVVACEASDGSWCEFDADTLLHASILADNAVDKLGARGCSVREVRPDGSVGRTATLYTKFSVSPTLTVFPG